MSKVFKAYIHWLPESEGGRKSLPESDKYAPIISLSNDELDSRSENWSIFVKIEKIISKYETIAELKYLSDSAPNNLHSADRFCLYEGPKIVARGIIL